MKITYLHQYFTTPEFSGGTRSFEIAKRLVRRGHEVTMITSDAQRRQEDTSSDRTGSQYDSVEEGIQVKWIKIPYSNGMGFKRRLLAFAQFLHYAGRLAVQTPADLVFATSTPLTIALPGVKAARKLGVPMVFEVRDLWPEMPIALGVLRHQPMIAAARWLERYAYRHASHVVALSPCMRDGVMRAGVPSDEITVIPNSCDFDLFDVPKATGLELRRRHEWLQDRPLIVYTGAIGMANNVDYFAKLAAAVRQRDEEIRFLTVGSGNREEMVRETAKQLGVLDRNFFMWPPIPKRDIPAVFSAADIVTSLICDIPEVWRNSSNKLFDGMAARRPVAINYEGWHADRIRENGSGLVLDRHDIESAADLLVSRICDEQWLARAGEASQRIGREEFDRDKLAMQFETVLVNAVKGRQDTNATACSAARNCQT